MATNVEWTADALVQAQDALEIARTYGIRVQRDLAANFETITRRLGLMPRMGTIEQELVDEDGEFRYLHANKFIKVVYKVISEDHVLIFAVVSDYTPSNVLKQFL